MAGVFPFAAIRYPQHKQTDLLAPPYDVLSGSDKERMLARNPANIVAVDLPHIPPKEAGPDEVYAAAGKMLQDWIASGVLKKDATAGFYAYQQTYSHGETTYKRRGFFARVKLEEFGLNSTIHPHEQTFSGPKEDRLKLFRATKANLSPVFGLYDDPENDVTDLLFEAVGNASPLASADLPALDGKHVVTSDLWLVSDAAVIADVQKMMASKHIYIADGHHRYTTSLNYRKEAGGGRILDPNDPINYALFVLIAMQDPGLIIMPTHRTLATADLDDFYLEKFRDVADKHMQVIDTKLRGDSLGRLEQELPGYGPHAIGVYDPIEDTALVIKPKSDDPLGGIKDDAILKDKSSEWRQLDVAILQHLVFERIVLPAFGRKGVAHQAGAPGGMHYGFPHEAHEVTTMCRSGQYRVGFLLQPTPLTAVRDLCNANELMPQKSTFFYPKLATGMVINTLY